MEKMFLQNILAQRFLRRFITRERCLYEKKLLILSSVLIIGFLWYQCFGWRELYVISLKQKHHDNIIEFYENNRVSLNHITSSFYKNTVSYLSPEGLIRINSEKIGVDELDYNDKLAIHNLCSSGQFVLFESFPDGIRFQISSPEKRDSLNIIFVHEKFRSSRFWDSYFLLAEQIEWINDNWYISYGLSAK